MALYDYVDTTGVIVPDTSDLITDVDGEFTTAIPSLTSTDPTTPQGTLIAAEVNARAAVVGNNAAVANQINPNISGGIFLLALCELTGLTVPSATPSVMKNVVQTGVAGTMVPAGQICTIGGNQFQSVSTTTLTGGTATVDYQSVLLGPIPGPAGSLSIAPGSVLGLETVTNPATAILGLAALSDADIRTLRNNTLGLQGIGLNVAIQSLLYAVPGVSSLAYLENIASTTQTIDGISLVAHSIWACVEGGLDLDVATALFNGKSMGANWNGVTSVNVTDPTSGQVYPVLFDRPTGVPVFIRATIRANTTILDPATTIANAILAYTSGQVPGETGFVVGGPASPFELAGAVVTQVPGAFVTKMEVSPDGSTWQTTEMVIALNQICTTNFSSITVLTG
jgi:hypothetical protein